MLAGERLEVLVEGIALELHALALSELVLGRVHEAKARAAVTDELLDELGELGELAVNDGEVVVARLAVAVRIGRLLLVGVVGEGAIGSPGEGAGEAAVGVAAVALAKQFA